MLAFLIGFLVLASVPAFLLYALVQLRRQARLRIAAMEDSPVLEAGADYLRDEGAWGGPSCCPTCGARL